MSVRTQVSILSRVAVLAALVAAVAFLAARPNPGTIGAQATGDQVEPGAGAWPTWLLSSGRELRLPAPPNAAETQAELQELRTLVAARDGAARDRIARWDAGAPPYRWTAQAVKHAQAKGVVGNRAGRLLALMNIAVYDATVATWDSKYTYNRPRPGQLDPSLATAIATPRSPSYPDEHAAAAGAASTVLAYIFPQDAEMFAAWAEEAARSRLEAGVAFPSDVAAGLALGRQVGERAVAWGKADGSDATWTGTVPTEPGHWTGMNPVEPMAGTWKPWALSSGSQFRPGPPPALDSAQMATDLAEVKNYPRTNLTNLTASFWEYYGGRGAFEFWNDQAARKIFEYRLADNPPRAARVYALMNAAFSDSLIACWDAKYAYWAPRPAMVDSTITTVFVTPNHPEYPSAHSCIAGASGGVLAKLFPADAAYFDGLTKEAGEARIMGGIHFRTAVVAGAELGRKVADIALGKGTIPGSP